VGQGLVGLGRLDRPSNLSVVNVHLLIDHELNVTNLVVAGDLWEKTRYRESDIFFFESVGLAMLRVHAAVVNDVLHHLVDHLREVVGDSVLEDISAATGVRAELLQPLLIKDCVILLFGVERTHYQLILLQFFLLLQNLNLA
jgi:hypothetical protein